MPAPSDRALFRANELADTQKQLADEAERVLRRLGLSWHEFAQHDRAGRPWIRKPWHRQPGGWRPGQKALVHVRRPWTDDDERYTVTRLPEWSGRKKWRQRNTGKDGPGRPKLGLGEFAVLTVRQEIADRMNGYKIEDARLATRGEELATEDLGLDAETQAEEEGRWVYRVATFLEDATGKSLAQAFLDVVDTSAEPDVFQGLRYLLNLEEKADTVHLRPSFNYAKWVE
jgi:hypothetical protein